MIEARAHRTVLAFCLERSALVRADADVGFSEEEVVDQRVVLG